MESVRGGRSGQKKQKKTIIIIFNYIVRDAHAFAAFAAILYLLHVSGVFPGIVHMKRNSVMWILEWKREISWPKAQNTTF